MFAHKIKKKEMRGREDGPYAKKLLSMMSDVRIVSNEQNGQQLDTPSHLLPVEVQTQNSFFLLREGGTYSSSPREKAEEGCYAQNAALARPLSCDQWEKILETAGGRQVWIGEGDASHCTTTAPIVGAEPPPRRDAKYDTDLFRSCASMEWPNSSMQMYNDPIFQERGFNAGCGFGVDAVSSQNKDAVLQRGECIARCEKGGCCESAISPCTDTSCAEGTLCCLKSVDLCKEGCDHFFAPSKSRISEPSHLRRKDGVLRPYMDPEGKVGLADEKFTMYAVCSSEEESAPPPLPTTLRDRIEVDDLVFERPDTCYGCDCPASKTPFTTCYGETYAPSASECPSGYTIRTDNAESVSVSKDGSVLSMDVSTNLTTTHIPVGLHTSKCGQDEKTGKKENCSSGFGRNFVDNVFHDADKWGRTSSHKERAVPFFWRCGGEWKPCTSDPSVYVCVS